MFPVLTFKISYGGGSQAQRPGAFLKKLRKERMIKGPRILAGLLLTKPKRGRGEILSQNQCLFVIFRLEALQQETPQKECEVCLCF